MKYNYTNHNMEESHNVQVEQKKPDIKNTYYMFPFECNNRLKTKNKKPTRGELALPVKGFLIKTYYKVSIMRSVVLVHD